MRDESGDDAYQDSFRNGKIHFAIISNGVNPLRSILLYIKFIFPKGEDVNCKIREFYKGPEISESESVFYEAHLTMSV